GIRVPELQHLDGALLSRDVEVADDIDEPGDVRRRVDDDDGVRRDVGADQSLPRHERLQTRGRRARLEVDQGNDARDERVRRRLRPDLARQPASFYVLPWG